MAEAAAPPDGPPRRARPRSRSFGPVVLAGLAGAVLAAVAASRDWAHASGSAAGVAVAATAKGSSTAPLAVSLALVAMAAWGVVLVVRGRLRQAVAALGLLASAGVVAATVASAARARHDAAAAVVARGGTGHGFDTSLTGWYYACALAALVCAVAFLAASVLAPRWPAMGSRYDAPAARAEQPLGSSEQELWRAFDEGHDPTA